MNKVCREESDLLTASILPDEFSCGYRGRLRVLNDFSSIHELMANLREFMHTSEALLNGCEEIAMLASAAEVTVEQFVREHSLLPLHRLVPHKDFDIRHGDLSRPDLIGRHGLRNWRNSIARYCPECLKEELCKYGYAIWHRSHQLPGIIWCCSHGQYLLNCIVGKRAFDQMPSFNMDAQCELADHEYQEIISNSAIRRYAEILKGLLKSEHPVAGSHGRYSISILAQKYKIRQSADSKPGKPTLSDFIQKQVPDFWLKILYPDIECKVPGKFFGPIDRVLRATSSDQTYALALAVLFESTDDALRYWYSDLGWMPKAY